MKKKIQGLILAIIIINANAVYAVCDYNKQAELNNIASKVKVSYEIKKETKTVHCEGDEMCEIPFNHFKIMLLNLDENVYIEVRNDINKETKRLDYKSADKDGIVYFDWDNTVNITNFTFTIYSSNKTACSNEKLAIKYLTTPRENIFANYEQCEKMTDFEYCQEFVTFKEIKYDEFNNKFQEKLKEKEKEEEKNKSFWQKLKEFFNGSKVIFIISAGILAAGVIIYIILNRKAKKI